MPISISYWLQKYPCGPGAHAFNEAHEDLRGLSAGAILHCRRCGKYEDTSIPTCAFCDEHATLRPDELIRFSCRPPLNVALCHGCRESLVCAPDSGWQLLQTTRTSTVVSGDGHSSFLANCQRPQ